MADENINEVNPLPEWYKRLQPLLKSEWDFIVEFHPDYYHSDMVAEEDDLDCLIHGECDEEKEARLVALYGNDPDMWRYERECLYNEILNDAIENFERLFNK